MWTRATRPRCRNRNETLEAPKTRQPPKARIATLETRQPKDCSRSSPTARPSTSTRRNPPSTTSIASNGANGASLCPSAPPVSAPEARCSGTSPSNVGPKPANSTTAPCATALKSLWQVWRAALPQGKQIQELATRRMKLWAYALDPDFGHSEHVARMALELYDGLGNAGLLNSDHGSDERFSLWAAALLHDVGKS